jgi:hypothetical protein
MEGHDVGAGPVNRDDEVGDTAPIPFDERRAVGKGVDHGEILTGRFEGMVDDGAAVGRGHDADRRCLCRWREHEAGVG